MRGKTFERWPEMIDNVIPFIGGEEEKSEKEPLKIWGKIENGEIVPAESPKFTAQCIRVPVSDGHLASVFVDFKKKPTKEEILEIWANYSGEPQALSLPHAPKQFLHYYTEDDMPQTRLCRDSEGGMAISVGTACAACTAGPMIISSSPLPWRNCWPGCVSGRAARYPLRIPESCVLVT